MLIDITQTTKLNKVYREGSPPLKVDQIECTTQSGHSYSTYHLSCATHNMGTHIDVIKKNVDLPLNRLVCNGVKFDVSHVTDRPIQLDDLNLDIPLKDKFVFFQTNWDQYVDEDDKYSDHPEIDFSVISYLVEQEVNMIGIDTLGLGRGKNHGKIDVFLGQHERYAIENLCNLEAVPERNFKVYCLPSKFEGIDVLPCRILVEAQ